jgi:hypothetical protein
MAAQLANHVEMAGNTPIRKFNGPEPLLQLIHAVSAVAPFLTPTRKKPAPHRYVRASRLWVETRLVNSGVGCEAQLGFRFYEVKKLLRLGIRPADVVKEWQAMASRRLLLLLGRCCLAICCFFERIDRFAANFACRRSSSRWREFMSAGTGDPPSNSFTNFACGWTFGAFGLWPAR